MPDPITPFLPVVGNVIGGMMQQDAADTAAASQAEAARIAADAAAFRPVGLTTRFGKSGYTYDPEGRLVGAGYELAPDLAAMREGMMGLAGGSLYQAQQMRQLQPYIDESATNLFKLGTNLLPKTLDYQASPEAMGYAAMLRNQATASMPQSYNTNPTAQAQQYANQLSGIAGSALPTNFNAQATPEAQGLYNQLTGMANKVMPTSYDPTARANQYMQQQQALLAPGREQELAKVRNSLQQTGRAGLAFGATEAGRQAATNPEMAAYYNALAQQDAQLAANAQTAARGELQQDINIGQNLGTTGFGVLNQSQQQGLQNALSKGQFATGLMGTGFGATTQSGQQQLQNAMALGQYSTGMAGTALNTQQQAEALARQNMLSNIQTGAGLLGTGINTVSQGYGLQTASLDPWLAYLQGAKGVEALGANAMDLSSALGAKQSTAGANQGNFLAKTGTPYTGSALGSGLMGLANNQGAMNALGGLFKTPTVTAPGFGSYGANISTYAPYTPGTWA